MRVRAFATLRDLVGGSETIIDLHVPVPVRGVLRRLAAQHPALAAKLWDSDEKLTGQVLVLLNGRSLAAAGGLDTEVCNRDTLTLCPPVGGG